MRILIQHFIFFTFIISCATHKNETANMNQGNAGCFTDVGDAKVSEVAFTVTKCILPNGLTLIISENHRLPIFSFYTFYDVGSRHEKKGTTGGSHVLEHMLFKGSENYGFGVFDSEIEKNGGSTNAYTHNDQTVYHENVPSLMLESVIKMDADRFMKLSLEVDSFEKERAVILEERKLRYENSPRGKLYINVMKELFAGTPYEESVIGTNEDLTSMTHKDIFNYYKENYSPEKATIVIVGDVNTKETIDLLTKHMSPWVRKDPRPGPPSSVFQSKLKESKVIKLNGTAERPIFTLAFKGYPIQARESYVTELLASLYADGKSSPLYEKYVLGKKPLLTNISLYHHDLKYSGALFVSGELASGASIDEVRESLLKDLRYNCNRAINARTIAKVKNQFTLSLFKGFQTNAELASFLGELESYTGDFRRYKEEFKIYKSINENELRAQCLTYFEQSPSLFVSIWKDN